MKRGEKLDSQLRGFWNPEKSEIIQGQMVEVTDRIGKGDVLILKTDYGLVGVNVYSSLKSAVAQMKPGQWYELEYTGKETSKSGQEYYAVEVYELLPGSDKKEVEEGQDDLPF